MDQKFYPATARSRIAVYDGICPACLDQIVADEDEMESWIR